MALMFLVKVLEAESPLELKYNLVSDSDSEFKTIQFYADQTFEPCLVLSMVVNLWRIFSVHQMSLLMATSLFERTVVSLRNTSPANGVTSSLSHLASQRGTDIHVHQGDWPCYRL